MMNAHHLQKNIHYYLANADFETLQDPERLKGRLRNVLSGLAPLYHCHLICTQEEWVLWEDSYLSKIAILIEPAIKDLNSDTSVLFKKLQVSQIIIISQNIQRYSEITLLRHFPYTFLGIQLEKVRS